MFENSPLKLGVAHHYALDQMDRFQGSLFLTGKAGTGKSTLIQLFRKLSGKQIIFLAPTGVAAVNIKGQTIHSFFKFPPAWVQSKDYKLIPKKHLQKIDLIVIDEISMMRADLLDHVDKLLRYSAKDDRSFGGIPMIWTGDLFQLPPVLKSNEEKEYFMKNYETPYFFSSNVFNRLEQFEMIELEEVFRQRDQRFIKLLNKIRMNEIDEDELEIINSRVDPELNSNHEHFAISLTATNMAAHMINKYRLNSLPASEKIYTARIVGQVNPTQYPAEELLLLKEGAQIMMLRNDPLRRFVNGSLGIISKLKEESMEIILAENGKAIELEAFDWEITKYKLNDNDPEIKTEVIGHFTQFPIRLAWAITIHKSQGQTFDKIIIDLGRGAFEHGHVYVALSRCKSLAGIHLKQPLQYKDIRTDERILDFLNRFR